MVGALSIIRFRAAIKDPEELIFLFINISIGIGLGAQRQGLTVLIFLILMAILLVLRFFKLLGSGDTSQGIFIRLPNKNQFSLEKLQSDLAQLSKVKIKKYEESPGGIQLFLETHGAITSQNELINYFRNNFENPVISFSEIEKGSI
jgi:hypothetical protein